ncbi:SAVMC3_10250 family protein [Nocardia sp. NPDC057353]|uniref:SAVMC3_10250 family protein n=1 Tax=Nocardia sp. NPDC057353 TaxID=3346104 RepID=UPI00363AA3BE
MNGVSVYNEFAYCSSDKVRQFMAPKSHWWERLRATKVNAGLKVSPVEAALEVEPAVVGGDQRKLEKLVKHLEERGRYYTEPDVYPGEWVMFEGWIGLAHVEADPAAGGVLFCEAQPLTVATPRILLHGSGKHLQFAAAAAAEHGRPGGYSLATGGINLLETLTAAHRAGAERTLRRLLDRVADGTEPHRDLTTYFREVACGNEFRDTAPYLAGHARVTAVLRPPGLPFPVVLASPLYVRYERP